MRLSADPEFNMDTNVYQVKGLFHFGFHHHLSFGEFKTDNIKFDLMATDSSNDGSVTEKQRISFKQFDTISSQNLLVACESYCQTGGVRYQFKSLKFRSPDMYYYKVNLNNQYEFTLSDQGNSIFNFGNDTVEIDLKNIYDKKTYFNGYYLTLNRKLAAAVSFNSQHKIWIKNNFDERERILIAAVSTALLLMPPKCNLF